MLTRMIQRLRSCIAGSAYAASVMAMVVIGVCVPPVAHAAAGECEPEWLLEELHTHPYYFIYPTYYGIGGGMGTAWDPDGEGPAPEELIVAFGSKTIDRLGNYAPVQAWNGQRWRTLGDPSQYWIVTALSVYEGKPILWSTYSGARALMWDGEEWAAFAPGLSGTVNKFVEKDGDLWVAGQVWLSADAPWEAPAAKWDGETWEVQAPLPGRAVDIVDYRGAMHVCGEFTVDGQKFNGVFRLDSGGWTEVGRADAVLKQMIVHQDRLIAVGYLKYMSGVLVNGLASWDGQQWVPFASQGILRPESIAVFRDSVHVGVYSPGTISSLLSWDGTQWRSENFRGSGPRMPTSVVVYGDQIVLVGAQEEGGPSRSVRNTLGYVAGWDGASSHLFHDRYIDLFTGNFQAWTSHQGNVVMSGSLAHPMTSRKSMGVCVWNGENWKLLGRAFNKVDALGSTSLGIVAGGDILTDEGAQSVALWRDNAWRSLGFGVYRDLHAFTEYNNQLIAAGSFDRLGSGSEFVGCHSVARFDGTAWHPMGTAIRGTIYALAVYNGELFAGGSFQVGVSPSPPTNSGMARWNGSEWVVVEGFRGEVRKLLVHDGRLVVLGSFVVLDNPEIRYIARWDGSTWSGVGDTPWLNNHAVVHDMTLHKGELVIVGAFFGPVSDGEAAGIAGFDGSQWRTMADVEVDNHGSYQVFQQFTRVISDGELLHFASPIVDPGIQPLPSMVRLRCVVPPCVADTDGSGGVDVADLFAYINAWLAKEAAADVNADEAVDVADLFAFINAWLAKC